MNLFNWFKKKQTTEKYKSNMISEIKELGVTIKENNIILIDVEVIHLVKPILNSLENWKNDFAFYDPIINPSSSDPGAYFSYSFDVYNTIWKMTYGNHGWSGGIYKIEKNTLFNQIENIIRIEKSIELETKDVAFFSHYHIKSDSENKEMNKELESIHSLQS